MLWEYGLAKLKKSKVSRKHAAGPPTGLGARDSLLEKARLNVEGWLRVERGAAVRTVERKKTCFGNGQSVT